MTVPFCTVPWIETTDDATFLATAVQLTFDALELAVPVPPVELSIELSVDCAGIEMMPVRIPAKPRPATSSAATAAAPAAAQIVVARFFFISVDTVSAFAATPDAVTLACVPYAFAGSAKALRFLA